jgi:CDP-diacylglycerol--glycerol-3-phosphate 3-phosphatidyltransferase
MQADFNSGADRNSRRAALQSGSTRRMMAVLLTVSGPHDRFGASRLAATSLTVLKPRLKRALNPLATRLAGWGITANQVTIASVVGSLAVGTVLCVFADEHAVFAILPIWVVVRMICATVDGTLAIDFGQKSRLGGILNEVGDILSDIALFLPLAFVPPFQPVWIACLIALTVLSELAGMAGPLLGGTRRVDGPLGKADRCLFLSAIGIWLACVGSLPESVAVLLPICSILLLVTIANRVRFARRGRQRPVSRKADTERVIGTQEAECQPDRSDGINAPRAIISPSGDYRAAGSTGDIRPLRSNEN